jgi:hypothetical protein
MTLKDKVYGYPTKNEAGFIQREINELLKEYPYVAMDKFNDALVGITGMVDKNGNFITYHCDILTALRCGLEDRYIKITEWD